MTDRRRFALLTAARWAPVGLLTPVSVLVMQARGLDLTTIGLVAVTYTVTVAALEIPTGSVADRFGDRRVLVAGTCFSIATFTTFLFARAPIAFFAMAVLHGIDRALRSGPLEAWFVSRTLGVPEAADVRRGLSAAAIAECLALAGAALFAGALPLLVPAVDGNANAVLTPLTLPIVAAIGLELVHLVALFAWLPGGNSRIRVSTTPPRSPLRIARDAGVLVARNPQLRRLLLAPVAIGFALYSVELLWQPRLAAMLGGATDHTIVFGIFGAVAFSCSAAGAATAPRVAGKRLGPPRAARAALVAFGVALVLLAASGSPALLGAAFGTSYVFVGMVGPLHGELLHERIASDTRATVLSLVSMAQMLGLLLAALTLPRVAEHHGVPTAWLVAAVVAAASSLCYVGLRDRVVTRAGGTA